MYMNLILSKAQLQLIRTHHLDSTDGKSVHSSHLPQWFVLSVICELKNDNVGL